MCLAVPGRIQSVEQRDDSRVARIEFGGVVREVSLAFVPEADEGDYVLVHVGFALTKVDEEEARRTIELLEELGTANEDGFP